MAEQLKYQIIGEDKSQGAIKSASSGLTSLANVAAGVGLAVAAVGVASAPALMSIGKAAITEAANFETTTLAFSTMLGSAEQAQKLLNDLAQFASTTPFTITGIEDSARQLLAYGVSADDMIPTLTNLGQIAAGLSAPLDQVALAYGQVLVKGKLAGQEVLQFFNAGVPITELLADNMGITKGEVEDLVSKGEIGFPKVQEVLQNLTAEGGKFNGMFENASGSVNQLISNLQDKMTLTLREIGGSLLPMVKEAINFLNPILDQLSQYIITNVPQWVEQFRAWLDYLWLEFGPMFMEIWTAAREEFNRVYEVIKPNLDVMIDTLKKMLMQIMKTDAEGIKPFIAILGDLAFGAIPLVIDWITQMILIIGTLITWYVDARNTVMTVIAVFTDFGASISSVASSISGTLVGALNTLIGSLRTAYQWAKSLMDTLLGMVGISVPSGGSGSKAGFRNANGNIFNSGQIMAFANGGIVSKPTLFPMANGMGLMGEAGPEAVMPLKRLSNGKLGVESIGRGLTINISGNNFYGDDKEFAERVGNTIIKELKSNLAIQGF